MTRYLIPLGVFIVDCNGVICYKHIVPMRKETLEQTIMPLFQGSENAKS